jgi:hypothetical protein
LPIPEWWTSIDVDCWWGKNCHSTKRTGSGTQGLFLLLDAYKTIVVTPIKTFPM